MSKDADESTGASGQESGVGSRLGRGTEGLGFWASREKKGTAEGQGTVQSRASEFAFAGAGVLGDEKLHREAV